MIAMTDEMRDLVDNAMEYGTPCIVGTVDPEGGPHVGFRGSVMVFDDEHLAWWERTMRGRPRTSRATQRWWCCSETLRNGWVGSFTVPPSFTVTAPSGSR